MHVGPKPDMENISVTLGVLLRQRVVGEQTQRESGSIHRKATSTWVLVNANDMFSGSTVDSICDDHSVGSNALTVNDNACIVFVLKIFFDANTEMNFDAKRDGVVIHQLLQSSAVCI